MNNINTHLDHLETIRSIMERSSKFISLSGWAGIFAGTYALISAYIGVYLLNFNPTSYQYSLSKDSPQLFHIPVILLLIVALLNLSVITAVYFTFRKSKQQSLPLWNTTSKLLLEHISMPLVIGAILSILFYLNGFIGLIAPITLLFYGLSLHSASKFTYNEIKYLGGVQLLCGLLAIYWIEYSMLLWSIGFGWAHIIYGAFMYQKYER